MPIPGRDNLVVRIHETSGYTTLPQKYPSIIWYLVLPVSISRNFVVMTLIIISSDVLPLYDVTLDN